MATSPLNIIKESKVPDTLGSDEDFIEKYKQGMQKVYDALEARTNRGTNLFSVAQGFLAPTRTGSFDESLGNAAGVLGKEQEQRDAEMLPIAQMRAEMMGKEYEINKQQKGAQILGSILGTDPKSAVGALSTGNLPTGLSRMANGQQLAALTYYDPKAGAALKSGIEIEQKNVENALNMLKNGLDITKATENMNEVQKADFINNMKIYSAMTGIPIPESILGSSTSTNQPTTTPTSGSKVSSQISNNNPGNIMYGDVAIKMGATGKAANGAAIFPDLGMGTKAQQSLLSSQYGNIPINQIADRWAPKDDGKNPQLKGNDPVAYTRALQQRTGFDNETMNKKFNQLTPDQQQRFMAAQTGIEHGIPFSPQQQSVNQVNTSQSTTPGSGIQKRKEENWTQYNDRVSRIETPQMKTYADKANALQSIDEANLIQTNGELDRLREIATSPNANSIFGVFQTQNGQDTLGRIATLSAQALQEGIGADLGPYHARIKLDLEKLYQNAVLSDNDKLLAQEASNIMAKQVINNIIARKSQAFGNSRVTNYQDAQLTQLNANTKNTAAFINLWALQRQIDNEYILGLRDEYSKFVTKNEVAEPKHFFEDPKIRRGLIEAHIKAQKEALAKFGGNVK